MSIGSFEKVECKDVYEIGSINFEGNIIPHEWYQHLKTEKGHTDIIAIIILSEIVFLHRPYKGTDKKGKVFYKQRFSGKELSLQVAYLIEKFGFTDDQTRDALKRLEVKHKLIKRDYRTVLESGKRIANVMFIKLKISRLKAITNPIPEELEAETDEEPKTPATPKPKPTQQPERRRSVENEKAFQEVLRKFRGEL